MANIKYEKFYTRTNELTDAFSKLADICISEDEMAHSFFVDEEYTSSIHVPFAYGAYDEEKLVGFLSVYELDQYNVEFCVFVLPEYRRQTIASNLFFRMVMDYDSRSFRAPLAPGNEIGEAFVTKMGLTFSSCEISMALSKDDFTAFPDDIVLESEANDRELMVKAYIDNICVGNAVIYGENGCACIHDVEVDEDLRENGYGYRMVMAILEDAFEKFQTVILHVTRENTPAVKLYEKVGFTIKEEVNYYEI